MSTILTMSLIKKTKEKGFALLITLVVVSVVLAIGLSLLFVTTKQYLLAITATESEEAFHAAQIGLECMRYHRVQPNTRDAFLRDSTNTPPTVSCAGVTSNILDSSPILGTGGIGGVWMYRYRYRFDLGSSCVDTSLYIADYRDSSLDSPYNISSYSEGLSQIQCMAGTICTVVFSRGYNRPCGQLDSIFTIQREITVEF